MAAVGQRLVSGGVRPRPQIVAGAQVDGPRASVGLCDDATDAADEEGVDVAGERPAPKIFRVRRGARNEADEETGSEGIQP